jgi:hypothetical protein
MRCGWLSVIALLTPVFLSGQTRSQQETPTEHKHSETQASPSTAGSVTPVQPISPKQQNETAQKSPKCPLPEWADPFWSNWALVVITGIAVLLARDTLRDLREQTSNARKTAKAALLNAQAVINAERPWVLVAAQRIEKIGGGFVIQGTIKGRTPARITEIYSHRIFIDLPDNLPPSPKYDEPVIAPKEPLLVSGESFKIAEVKPELIVAKEWRERHPHFNPYQFLCFYGVVRYEDCLARGKDRLHETRWCFAYFAEGDNDLHPVGAEEYRRKT